MRKAIIIFGVLLILLVSGIILLYFYFEKPKQEALANSIIPLNIYALDEDGNNVITNYIINVNGIKYKEGETLIGGGSLENVPVNSSIVIYNKNLDNQQYYTYEWKKQLTDDLTPQRVNLMLQEPGSLIITQDKKLGDGNRIILNISSNGLFNKMFFCIKWSMHIIDVNSVFEQIEPIKRYELWDKCYNTERSLDNSSAIIAFDYSTFGTLDNSDFINVVFIDSDCVDNICQTSYTDNQNITQDVGAKDVIFELKQ